MLHGGEEMLLDSRLLEVKFVDSKLFDGVNDIVDLVSSWYGEC